MAYNAAFFGAHESYFLIMKERLGEEKALEILKLVMEMNFGKAYTTTGFKKGDPHSFASAVGERDRSVGLRVEFPEISERKIVYRFLTDPFPGLKGHVDPHKLDDTYMKFKVDFLLGSGWHYRTTKHI